MDHDSSALGDLLEVLPSIKEHHAHTSKLYALLKQVARREVERLFGSDSTHAGKLGPIGELFRIIRWALLTRSIYSISMNSSF